ncbi:MAG: hypothetical protein IPG52_08425 [Rhodocyclaceae bacterium]|nr:hypothetical protein [Rhodocyclaceae bacterium]
MRKASESCADVHRTLFNLHGQRVDLGDIDGAIASYDGRLDIDPANADNRFFLGMLQTVQRRRGSWRADLSCAMVKRRGVEIDSGYLRSPLRRCRP